MNGRVSPHHVSFGPSRDKIAIRHYLHSDSSVSSAFQSSFLRLKVARSQRRKDTHGKNDKSLHGNSFVLTIEANVCTTDAPTPKTNPSGFLCPRLWLWLRS